MKVKNFAVKVDKKGVTSLIKDLNTVSKIIARINKQNLGKSLVSNKTSNDIRSAATNIALLGNNAKKASTQLNNVSKALDKDKKSLDSVTKSTGKSSKSFTAFAKNAIGIIGVGMAIKFMAGIARKAVKDTAEFNRQVRIAGLISKDTKNGDSTEALRSRALEIGGATEYTAKQVADLELTYAKLGFTATDILGLIKTTTDAATVSQEDLGLTAEVVGNAIHAFGLDVEDAGRVSDVMAKSFTSSALNLEKFKVGIATAGSSARASNVSLEKTVAMLGVLSDAGFEASKSATSLRNIFLISQTEGKNYDKVLGSLVGTNNALAKASDLFGRRAAAAAVILALERDAVKQLNEKLIEAKGFSEQTAEQIRDDLQGSLDKLKSGWDNISIILTTKAAPALKRFIDYAVDSEIVFTKMLNNQAQMNDEADSLEHLFMNIRDISSDVYTILTGWTDELGFGKFGKTLDYVSTGMAGIAEFAKSIYHNIANFNGDSNDNVNAFTAGADASRRKKIEIQLYNKATEEIKRIRDGDLSNIEKYNYQLKRLADKEAEILSRRIETKDEYYNRLANRDESEYKVTTPQVTKESVDKELAALRYKKGLFEKILSAVPSIVTETNKALNDSIEKMAKSWSKELGDIQNLTVERASNISAEIQRALEADNGKAEDDRMSKSLRKRLTSMFLQVAGYIDSATVDTYTKIGRKIKELKEKYYNTLEGDVIGRKKIEKEIGLLEARLKNLEFPAIPVTGLLNIARDNIKQINEDLAAAQSKDEIEAIGKLLNEAKKNLKDLELIQKRIDAQLDPKRTGVLKEDIQAALDANQRTFLAQQASILSTEKDKDKQAFLLRGAKLAKEKADWAEKIKIWEEGSIEYEDIVAKIQDTTNKEAANSVKFRNDSELQKLRSKYVDEYTSGLTKEQKEELTYAFDLATLKQQLEDAKNAEVTNAKEIGDLKMKIEDKVAAHAENKAKEAIERQQQLFDYLNFSLEQLNTLTDTISNFGAANDSKETSRITREYDARIKAAQGNADKVKRLEEEKDKALEKIQKRAFDRQKKLDMARAAIAGSQAILQVWAQPNVKFVLKVVESAFVAAKTLSEIAKISATEFKAVGGYTGKGERAPDHTGERPVGRVQLHEYEWVMPKKDLLTPEGAAIAHAGETLRTTGKMDLSQLIPFIPNSGTMTLSDSQMEQLAVIVASSTVNGLVAHAKETAIMNQMIKAAS